jgi:hypothetical protein
MPVATTIARVATILESISGVKSVYAGRPDDVPPAKFPSFIILTDGANYEHDGEMSDAIFITRRYRLLLVVAAWTTGIELASESMCRPYFAEIESAFLDRPTLEHPKGQNPLSFVQNARILSDSGILNIVIGGGTYAGVQWDLEVQELRERVFV